MKPTLEEMGEKSCLPKGDAESSLWPRWASSPSDAPPDAGGGSAAAACPACAFPKGCETAWGGLLPTGLAGQGLRWGREPLQG